MKHILIMFLTLQSAFGSDSEHAAKKGETNTKQGQQPHEKPKLIAAIKQARRKLLDAKGSDGQTTAAQVFVSSYDMLVDAGFARGYHYEAYDKDGNLLHHPIRFTAVHTLVLRDGSPNDPNFDKFRIRIEAASVVTVLLMDR